MRFPLGCRAWTFCALHVQRALAILFPLSMVDGITAGQTACQTAAFSELINLIPSAPQPWHSIKCVPGGNECNSSVKIFQSVLRVLMVLPLACSTFKQIPQSNLYVCIIAPFQGFNRLQIDLADPPCIHFRMFKSRFFGNDHWNPANDLEFRAITHDKHRNI